jgi:ribonucleoside-diphosphate reductase alpha chain
MAKDMLTAYKYGWKTSYYQNTYDFKGEEEDLQPSGIAPIHAKDDGEDVELTDLGNNAKLNNTASDDSEECEACTI